MTSVNWNNSTVSEPHTAPVSHKPSNSGAASASGNLAQTPDSPADTLQLSPAALREVALTGRVVLNEQAGTISSEAAAQLYGEISSIHNQILADRQAGGGTLSPSDAQAIRQLQSQLSQTIYSDTHDGAALPADPGVNKAGVREALEAGRIALYEKAGNLSSDQAQQMYSQLGAILQKIVADEQANGGSLSPADARAINHLQNQLSRQIHVTAHDTTLPDRVPDVNAA